MYAWIFYISLSKTQEHMTTSTIEREKKHTLSQIALAQTLQGLPFVRKRELLPRQQSCFQRLNFQWRRAPSHIVLESSTLLFMVILTIIFQKICIPWDVTSTQHICTCTFSVATIVVLELKFWYSCSKITTTQIKISRQN